jgi:hypothetical protein
MENTILYEGNVIEGVYICVSHSELLEMGSKYEEGRAECIKSKHISFISMRFPFA